MKPWTEEREPSTSIVPEKEREDEERRSRNSWSMSVLMSGTGMEEDPESPWEEEPPALPADEDEEELSGTQELSPRARRARGMRRVFLSMSSPFQGWGEYTRKALQLKGKWFGTEKAPS